MNIKNDNKCLICGEEIRWWARISEGNFDVFSAETSRVQGEAIAIGKAQTSTGTKLQFEVIVSCPRCRNKNKFNY